MATNPYKNKVVYAGTVLLDLTADTVTPERLLEGYTAHDASGKPIVGTATGGGVVISDTTDSHGGTIREITTANVITLGSKTITANGTYTASTDNLTGYNSVTVNVGGGGIDLQTKSVTPTESTQTVTADSGYDGLSSVEVGAISSTYVGSGVTRQAAKTVTPSETSQTAVASGVYTTGAVTVGAVSSTYVGSGVTRQAAKTVTPTKSSQTAVASGVYTTGAVTVAAIPSQYITTTDATASAADIASGETAYVNGSKVTGTLTFATYYTGSSTPSASQGSDGDIYLKVVN